MTLLFLSEPSGRASHLPSTAEQNNFMCLQSLPTKKSTQESVQPRGKKGYFFPVTGWRISSFQTIWCGGHRQRQTPESYTSQDRLGWLHTITWVIWSHTGFAAFRKWYSTIGHPGLGTFGQTASEARAFHPTPLCLHSQWHKCSPDGNWGQNMPSWLTRLPTSAKAGRKLTGIQMSGDSEG